MLKRLTSLLILFALSGCATQYGRFLSGSSVYGISQDTVITDAEAAALRRDSHYVTKLPNQAGLSFSFQSMKDRGQDNGDNDRLSDMETYHAPGGSRQILAVLARFEKGRRLAEGAAARFKVLGMWGFVSPFGWLWRTSDPHIFVTMPATATNQSSRDEVRIPDTAAFLAAFGPLRTADSLRAEVQAAVKARDVNLPGADLAAEMLNLLSDDPDYAAFAALPDFGGLGPERPDENSDRAATTAYLRRRLSIEGRREPYLKAGLPLPSRLKPPMNLKDSLAHVAWVLDHQRGLMRSARNILGFDTSQGPHHLLQEIESYLARIDRVLAAPTDLKARYQAYQAALAGPVAECAIAADAVIALLQAEEEQARREGRIATAVWIQKEIGRLNCGGHIGDPAWFEQGNLVRTFKSWPWHGPVAITLPPFVAVTGAGGDFFYPKGFSGVPTAGAPLATFEVRLVEYQVGTPVLDPMEGITQTHSEQHGRRQTAAWLKWKARYDALEAQSHGGLVSDPLAGVTVGPPTEVYSGRARVSAEAARGMREGRAAEQARVDAAASRAAAELERLKLEEPAQDTEANIVSTQQQVGHQHIRLPVTLRAEFEVDGQKRLCEFKGVVNHDGYARGTYGPGSSLFTVDQAREAGLAEVRFDLRYKCLEPVVKPIAQAAEAKWRAEGGEARLIEAAVLARHQALVALGPRGVLEDQARPLADDYGDKVTRRVLSADDHTPLDDLFRNAWGLPPLKK